MFDWAKQDKPWRSIRTKSLNRIGQIGDGRFEARQAGWAIKRAGHAVAQDNNRWLHGLQLFFKLRVALSWLIEIKTRASLASWCIAAPAKIAKSNVAIRELDC